MGETYGENHKRLFEKLKRGWLQIYVNWEWENK